MCAAALKLVMQWAWLCCYVVPMRHQHCSSWHGCCHLCSASLHADAAKPNQWVQNITRPQLPSTRPPNWVYRTTAKSTSVEVKKVSLLNSARYITATVSTRRLDRPCLRLCGLQALCSAGCCLIAVGGIW